MLLWLLASTGCATIISGRHQDVQVISSPQGAKACTEGQCVTTPGTFTLSRDSNHAVTIEKEGYLTETVVLTSGLGGAIAGNIILGGLIGGGVDMASGAAYKLYPETINVALRLVTAAPTEARVMSAPTPTKVIICTVNDGNAGNRNVASRTKHLE